MKKLATWVALLSVCAAANAADAGAVDGADSNGASGWACHSDQPYYQGWVHVYRDDGPFLGAIFAQNLREQAVANLCGGHPYHGFSGAFDYPSNLIDGKLHNVHFYFIRGDGSHFEIPGSPKQVQFGTPPASPLTQSGCNLRDPGPDWVGTVWLPDLSCSPPGTPYSGTRKKYQYLGTQSAYVYKSGDRVVACTNNEPAGWRIREVVDSNNCTPQRAGYVKNAFLLVKD